MAHEISNTLYMWYLNCYVNEFLQESYFMEQNIMLQYLLSNLFLLWRHIQSVHVNVLANLPRRWWSGLERFEHFPTSFMNIHCMKISLKFSKTIWCNKIKKLNFVYARIHHHVLHVFFPLISIAILLNRSTRIALNSSHLHY